MSGYNGNQYVLHKRIEASELESLTTAGGETIVLALPEGENKVILPEFIICEWNPGETQITTEDAGDFSVKLADAGSDFFVIPIEGLLDASSETRVVIFPNIADNTLISIKKGAVLELGMRSGTTVGGSDGSLDITLVYRKWEV